ncbi:hypothetical protein ACSTK1_23220 [Vibrio parahaemolyticus]|uniref:hypothetical protein n=1 Tax=Vibrio TaxID=662 RepID=UPI0000D533C2|nr:MULTISPECIES: hypothetical protein [Vibrio]EIT6977291.1 hypothetical protein [Vibrio vulnificus]EAS74228.1 hypothetical protein V12G01_09522 [Vibrio alginolyticus 12G01]EIU7747922.1 hypothetical protein [Vibrio vulnificus]EJQ9993762.1 hypothetical protein [Vibrio vulnificus]EKD9068823.1 hypothetical protein [Vibrio vulnificus]
MTWWIAFIIAVLGWYFTATQNAKNSTRALINQEIKEARAKLHDLIVSCSHEDCQFPLRANGEDFVKMQTYIVSIQELDKLYVSYNSPYFKHIRAISTCISLLTKLSEYQCLSKAKEFIRHWFIPQSHAASESHYSTFELLGHTSTIRQSLTSDAEDMNEETRLAMLNLEYKKLCLSYQFVS